MQGKRASSKSLCAIAGVLLSILPVAGCAVDEAPGDDDQVTDPADDTEIRETAPPAITADPALLDAADQRGPASTLPSPRSGVTANACRTTCRDVVHPELCLFIPFPFCLIPQHECVTLCDAP